MGGWSLSAGAEREALSGLLTRAAEGYSGALVLRGEPGVGKTALLDETLAAGAADGMQTARLTGVEPRRSWATPGCTGSCSRSGITWSGCRHHSGTLCAARSG